MDQREGNDNVIIIIIIIPFLSCLFLGESHTLKLTMSVCSNHCIEVSGRLAFILTPTLTAYATGIEMCFSHGTHYRPRTK